MTEEIKKDRTPEEMWADWARQELTDQAAELKDLRRFKREAEKDLRRFKKYSASLEKEVKTLREALAEIKKTVECAQDTIYPFYIALDSKDGSHVLEIAKQALKGGAE